MLSSFVTLPFQTAHGHPLCQLLLHADVQDQAQQSAAQYGTMYAGLVLVMLPTLILYICVQKQLTQGMTVGGLKG